MSASTEVPAEAYGAPQRVVEHETIEGPRCVYCRRKWAHRVTTPFEFKCERCGLRQTDRTTAETLPKS